jgi:hypothetical protein
MIHNLVIGACYHIVWRDGEEVVAQFVKNSRGYFVLYDKEGRLAVCHPEHIKVKSVSSIDWCPVCECDPCDCSHNQSIK